ncbi:ATP-dependent DNA helicase DDM1 [Hibiscus syriacus]|uniref:ATP-dependent DNA helicase DDM1 n=1 Tax=Hibiscus syriacus TaxID=106335 RepID=A0A6A2Z1S8_HIBSY|nr:ATP-dependent DNA helicase DDM1 [Hibiscus syriacus]
MEAEKGKENDASAESPTSVLEDEEKCEEEIIKLEEEPTLVDAKNGDASLLSEAMIKEEEKLMEDRLKEDIKQEEPEESVHLNDTQFTRLDELLTQTQMYSEFLLEKMEDITFNVPKAEAAVAKRGRGSKRRAANQYNNHHLYMISCFYFLLVLQFPVNNLVYLNSYCMIIAFLENNASLQVKKIKRAVAAMLTRSKEGESVNTEDENLTEEEKIEKEQRELVPLLTGGKLKSYQLKGVKWLISLWQNGLNGILADQMGLGKTIQTIAFLAHLNGNGMNGPYMIIAPLSTLSNWINEITRFTPSIDAIIYHGTKQERDEIRRKHMPKGIGPNFPIVVTSYEMAMSDAKKCLRHYDWKYVVVDEGHRLKNFKCKLVKELKHLRVANKLLLTGTPLQNNLAELWSLLNFILPDIFQSHEEFESWFDFSGRSNGDMSQEEMEEKRRAQVVAKLHAILRPFLLRRMKADVEHMLPRKKEIILYATLTEYQRNFQDHLLNQTLESYLKEKVDTGRGMKGKLNNLMIQLRKNCNHPDLLEAAFDGSYFYPPVEQIVEQCGKFKLLDRLLTQLFERKHKVLIFSQWTKVLDIMDYYFSEKGFNVCRIDGAVKLEERRRQIQEFNDVNSNYRIFILSTRAGGLGINLTAADTCILYDSDWNPQMDLQAMDRCHRIGQTKPVHVYRLATAQSVELKLEHVVIGKGQFHQERKPSNDVIEEDDLLALLRDEETAEDKMIQTDISDEDLERILDRSDLIVDSGNGEEAKAVPLKGPGWEVVLPTGTGGMLSTLNS